MRDTELYARILGIEEPWRVVDVELRLDSGEAEVVVEHGGKERLACPECGAGRRRGTGSRKSMRPLRS